MMGEDDRPGDRGDRSGDRESGSGKRGTKRYENRVAVALLLVSVSVGAVSGLLLGTSAGTAVGVAATDCTPDTGDALVWHIERYGTGCQEKFIRYPEGEQIDQIGEPPWAPL
ncbi:hypothetical protein [Haladaptatus sp. NG-SE-30]